MYRNPAHAPFEDGKSCEASSHKKNDSGQGAGKWVWVGFDEPFSQSSNSSEQSRRVQSWNPAPAPPAPPVPNSGGRGVSSGTKSGGKSASELMGTKSGGKGVSRILPPPPPPPSASKASGKNMKGFPKATPVHMPGGEDAWSGSKTGDTNHSWPSVQN